MPAPTWQLTSVCNPIPGYLSPSYRQTYVHEIGVNISEKIQNTKIQSTKLKKVNKLKCPSEDASVPEKKAITSGEGGRDLGRESGQEWGSV